MVPMFTNRYPNFIEEIRCLEDQKRERETNSELFGLSKFIGIYQMVIRVYSTLFEGTFKMNDNLVTVLQQDFLSTA